MLDPVEFWYLDAETEALRELLKKDCELLWEACGVEIEVRQSFLLSRLLFVFVFCFCFLFLCFDLFVYYFFPG